MHRWSAVQPRGTTHARLRKQVREPGTTGRRYVKEHIIPNHEVEWDSGVANRPYEYALDLDQQREARRIIRRLRPRSPADEDEAIVLLDAGAPTRTQ